MNTDSPIIYDLAIIGGGIAGSSIAMEASKRGLKVILFERNTFGSGTSSKSSKLIHGGLRYLETAWSALLQFRLIEFWKNLRFVFLALGETHSLAKQWPDLIKDIDLLMPIYRKQGRSKYSVFFGTWLYGKLSQLNGGLKGTKILKNAHEVLRLEPKLLDVGLIGGVLVRDHTTNDLALVNRIVDTARLHGAHMHEQTAVVRYGYNSDKKFYETQTLNQTYYAKHIINASGAWADQVRESGTHKKSEMIYPIAGAHIETAPFCHYSCIMQAADGRIFFIINRDGRARIGTTERVENDPDHVVATTDEVKYLLNGVKAFFPEAGPTRESILSMDAGIRPLAKPRRMTKASKISREHKIVKDELGVMHVLGVKLTDHRRAANELLDSLS